MHYTLCWPGPVVWGAKTQHLTQHHHHHQRKKTKKKRERMGFSHCVMHHTVVSHTPKNGKECVRFGERSFEWSVTGDWASTAGEFVVCFCFLFSAFLRQRRVSKESGIPLWLCVCSEKSVEICKKCMKKRKKALGTSRQLLYTIFASDSSTGLAATPQMMWLLTRTPSWHFFFLHTYLLLWILLLFFCKAL